MGESMSISVMHIIGGILIGIIVGRAFAMFTLRKIRGGKYTFMVVGVIGSILCDLVFKFLFENDLVSGFFYKQTTIMVEMVVGAAIACYVLNRFGKKERIEF